MMRFGGEDDEDEFDEEQEEDEVGSGRLKLDVGPARRGHFLAFGGGQPMLMGRMI